MDRFFICLLIDFYGGLLTSNQREIMKLYYENDLSLGEIAEELGISRQAVHYTLKRGLNRLKKVEEKLKLVDRFLKHWSVLESIKREIEPIMVKLPSGDRDKLKKLLKKMDSLIERGDFVV